MTPAAGTSAPVTCANHPRVETRVSCSDCGKPICPDCMVHAAVGIKCRDCARLPRSARVTLRAGRMGAAVAAAAGAGTLAGVVLGLIGLQGLGFGLATILLGIGVGIVLGRATLRASGYFRGAPTAWIAAGGAVWAYVVSGIVLASQVGGSARAYVPVLGLLVAGFFAHREAS